MTLNQYILTLRHKQFGGTNMKKILSVIGICTALMLANADSHLHLAEEDASPGLSFLTEETFETTFLKGDGSGGKTDDEINLIKYFSNLCEYSALNSIASCGYVSFAQYLSYYDTFYNDSIIPEKYEQNQGSVSSMEVARSVSPGVLRQSYPTEKGVELYDFIQNNVNSDYQVYLMSVVNESYNRSSEDYSCMTHMRDYHYIVDTISAFSDTSYSYKSPSDFKINGKYNDISVISGFDSYVKAVLDTHQPVMLHIASGVDEENHYEGYHSVVAYYYDEKGVHANFGWGENSTDSIIDDSGYYITEAGVIDFTNVEETHSNNYIVNQEHYCGCGKKTDHTYVYSRYSNEKHKVTCACGYSAMQNHTIKSGSATKLFGVCTKCAAKVNLGSTQVEAAAINFDSNDEGENA